MALFNNYIDYSIVLKKEDPIYNFTLYTPTYSIPTKDVDGFIWNDLIITEEHNNHVPYEMTHMNIKQLYSVLKNYVSSDGLIVEIGVWRDPNSPNPVSSSLFIYEKNDICSYLGIDIEDRSYILNLKPNIHFLQTDSSNFDIIKNYIDTNIKKEIDFLFIDGLHTVEQVKKELALINLVKKGGVIGFHDISAHAGPNMWMEAFDPMMFDIYKFRDTVDWGIGFLIKKF